MPQDFYVVLGVSHDADVSQIRRAYKRLARHYHPDTGGTPTERAYETLKDAEARRQHDRSLATESALTSPPATSSPTIIRHGRPVVGTTDSLTRADPARPFSWASPGTPRTTPLFAAIDEFFGGYVPGIYNTGRMASRRKDLYVELILDKDEARAGGFFPLDVPVQEVCPRCGGVGFEGLVPCPRCNGDAVQYHRITISVPPNVTSGTEQRLSLADIGVPEADLVLLVTVQP